MADVTSKRIEEFDSPNRGGLCRARAGLGVTAFGMQVFNFPPNFDRHPDHDHAADGQEEVYTALSGMANLRAAGEDYTLEPGVFVRVGPDVRRKITTADEQAQILVIGGTPGEAYTPWPMSMEGVPLPG